jgi:hypothetical protein
MQLSTSAPAPPIGGKALRADGIVLVQRKFMVILGHLWYRDGHAPTIHNCKTQ